jgi:hypothetical protein
MFVKNIEFDTYNSHLELFNIKLTNLTNPQYLSYNATINNSFVKHSDFPNILQNIDLSEVPNFVHTYIHNTKVIGSMDSVYAVLNIKSGIGDIKGTANIHYLANPQTYSIDLYTNGVNLAQIVSSNANNNADRFDTDINSHIVVKGSDFNIQKMIASANIELFPSRIKDFGIHNSTIAIKYRGNDTLEIEDFNINFTTHSNINDDANIDVETDVPNHLQHHFIRLGGLKVLGGVGIKSNHITPNIKLNAENLNLAKLLNDASLPSALSSTIEVNTDGIDLDNMQANARIDVSEIDFKNKSIFPFTIDADFISNDKSADSANNKTVRIIANNDFGKLFEIKISGDFTIESVTNKNWIDCWKNVIKNKIEVANNDTLKNTSISNIPKYSLQKQNFDIILDVKMINFLDIFVDSLSLNATDFYSRIHYISDSISSNIEIDSFKINYLDVVYNKNAIILEQINLSLLSNLEIIDNIPQLKKLETNLISSNVQKIINNDIDSLLLQCNYDNDILNILFEGRYNKLISAKLNGDVAIKNDNIVVSLDTFLLNYQNEIWRNTNDVTANYNYNSFSIDNFNIERENKEQ